MSILSFMPIIIVFAGSYLLIKLRAFFILHPIKTLLFTFNGQKQKENIKSLLLALAGTLGVGNIVGVAAGIAIGGAGSIFWLCISSLFSSAIKFTEVYLSTRNGKYGMTGVIASCGGIYKILAKIYAALVLILSITMGSLLQANAVGGLFPENKKMAYAIPIFLFTLSVAALGKDRIKGAVAIIIPSATILYTGICLFIVAKNFTLIIPTVRLILSEAFSPICALGGFTGFITASGMREGFLRGLLSNEAGAGTSSFSHTSHLSSPSGHNDAICAGIYGIIEVLFDTLLLCPMTALAVIIGGGTSFGDVRDVLAVFLSHCGSFGSSSLFASVLAFALSTTLCWYYYGSVSLAYLTPGFKIPFILAYFSFFLTGLLFPTPSVIPLNDAVLFLCTLLTLITIFKKRIDIPKINTKGIDWEIGK